MLLGSSRFDSVPARCRSNRETKVELVLTVTVATGIMADTPADGQQK